MAIIYKISITIVTQINLLFIFINSHQKIRKLWFSNFEALLKGLLFMAALNQIAVYWEAKRTMATQIGSCGTSVGMLLFPLIIAWLLETFTVPGMHSFHLFSDNIISDLFLTREALLLFRVLLDPWWNLFKPPHCWSPHAYTKVKRSQNHRREKGRKTHCKSRRDGGKSDNCSIWQEKLKGPTLIESDHNSELINSKIFSLPELYLYLLAQAILNGGYFAGVLYVSPFSQSAYSLTPVTAASMITIMGASELACR